MTDLRSLCLLLACAIAACSGRNARTTTRSPVDYAESDVTTALDLLKNVWMLTDKQALKEFDLLDNEEDAQRTLKRRETMDSGSASGDGEFTRLTLRPSPENVFIPPVFDPDRFLNVENSSVSSECMQGWYVLFNTTDNLGLSSGIKAVDAFGSIGAGFLQENIHALGLSSGIAAIDAFGKLGTDLQSIIYVLGSYDECLSLANTQYCLADFLVVKEEVLFRPKIRYALCLPQTCSENDIVLSVNLTNLQLQNSKLTIKLGEISCETDNKAPYNAGAIVMLVVWCFFAVMVLGATIVHFILKTIEKRCNGSAADIDKGSKSSLTEKTSITKTIMEFELAFSLYNIVPTILSTKQQTFAITSLNGIRVISMFWVILGHSLLWSLHFNSNSLHYVKNVVPRFTFQANLSAPFAVDSFFLLSGTLVAYLTLRRMDKQKGRFPVLLYYTHRFLRITPAYLFVLFSYWFLTVHLADGPLWQNTIGVESAFYKNCEHYWWTNMLYINNLYPWKVLDECMSWTWYLSNDMQFFIIAPTIIVPLYFFYPAGLVVIAGFLVVNLVSLGGVAGGYGLSGNMFILTDSEDSRTVADDIYTKPWTRIGPYLIGILLGFIFYKKLKPNFRKSINNIVYGILWMLAFTLCFSTVYGLYGSFNGETLSTAEDVSYQMFSRLAWSLGLAMVMLACHNGYGGIVNQFLSMKFWIPLSRLTFAAYLVHEIVLFVLIFTRRAPIYATDVTLSVYAIAAVVLSYGAAAVIASFVEFPLSNVETVIFRLVGVGGQESKRQAVRREEREEIEIGEVHENYYFNEVEKCEEGRSESTKWISKAERKKGVYGRENGRKTKREEGENEEVMEGEEEGSGMVRGGVKERVVEERM